MVKLFIVRTTEEHQMDTLRVNLQYNSNRTNSVSLPVEYATLCHVYWLVCSSVLFCFYMLLHFVAKHTFSTIRNLSDTLSGR